MTLLALCLRSFGVAFGDRIILSDVTLDLPRTGMTVLVGPAGCGKSTLLRTLAGHNDAHPSLTTWGDVTLGGDPLPMRDARHVSEGVPRPVLVVQHARFFLDTVRQNLVSALPNRSAFDQQTQTKLVAARLRSSGLGNLVEHLDRDAVTLPLWQQRRLAIVRALAADPSVLFADEPTAGLDERDAVEVIATLRLQATERAVVFVTHNQRLARAAGGTTVLLAGGRIQEIAPTRTFFSDPRTEIARQFVSTGGCAIPAPDAPPDSLRESVAPPSLPPGILELRKRASAAPRGFFWVQLGRMGGCPRPGIIDSVEEDLAGLQRLGVSVLVTLEENTTVASAALASLGIHSFHFPVVDMGVPEIPLALGLCRRADWWMRTGEVVVFHCRAGLGRTGTLLAAQLIWSGVKARNALESVRAINPRCIQSDVQVAFLRSFETAVADLQSAAGYAPVVSGTK